MPYGTEGVAKFFSGLGAGPALRQRAAAQGRLDAMREALTGAQIDDTNAESGLRQAKLDALDPATLATAFGNMQSPDTQAEGAAGLARAGNNADQIGGLMKALQIISAQRGARDAAIRGDQNLANANLFGATDKPVTLSQVTDGVVLNPTLTPDQNNFDPTAVGQAMINERNAAAGNASASAAATRAKLPLELRKLGAEAAKAGKDAGDKLPPIADVTSILPKTAPEDGNGTPQTDPSQVAQVLSWLAQHPKANVGDYVNQSPVGSPGAVVPSDTDVLLGALKVVGKPGAGEVESPAEDAGENGEEPGQLPAGKAPATVAPAAGEPAKPTTQAQFDALPKGALFINPADGRVMRKK